MVGKASLPAAAFQAAVAGANPHTRQAPAESRGQPRLAAPHFRHRTLRYNSGTSEDQSLLRHLVLFFASCASVVIAATAPLSCPETLKVAETATPIAGWKAAGGQSDHPFERVSVYNGTAPGQYYDLAPDHE